MSGRPFRILGIQQIAVEWLAARGVRFSPGGIRRGAAGHDTCFIHPRGREAEPDLL